MLRKFAITLVFVFAALLFCGCVSAPAGGSVKDEGQPPVAQGQAVAAADPAKPGVKAEILDSMAPAPVPPKAEAPVALTTEEIQKKREMESSLRAAFDNFWSIIKQKNIDAAAEAMAPERAEALKMEFYRFIGKFNISRADATAVVCNWGTAFDSEVSGVLMVFEKGSVAPLKKEIFQRWKYEGGKWLLNSHNFK